MSKCDLNKLLSLKVLIVLIFFVGTSCYAVFCDFKNFCDNSVPVLEYHAIGEHEGWPPDLVTSKEKFNEQLEYLHANGFEILSLEEMSKRFKNQKSVRNCVVLTFDDGYLDNYTNAYPMLKQYNAKASFFIVQSMIGKEGYMGHDEIAALVDSGMDLGSHTIYHPVLTDIDPKYLPWEIGTSASRLRKEFPKSPVILLSYPNGSYNDEIIDKAVEYGYQYGVTGKNGAVTEEIISNEPFELGRSIVKGDMEIDDYERLITKSYVFGYLYSKGIDLYFLKEKCLLIF